MKKRKQHVVAILLLFLLLLSLLGVANQKLPQSEVKPEAPIEPDVLSISHCQQDEEVRDSILALDKAYTSRTGKRLEWIYVPNAQYNNWIMTKIAAKQTPDLIWSSDSILKSLYEAGEVVNLYEPLQKDNAYTHTPWLESFDEEMIRYCINRDTEACIGIPITLSTVSLYYNMELLKEAGVEKPPETLTELMDCCRTVHQKLPSVTPFCVMNSANWNLNWMFTNAMQDLWRVQAKRFDVNGDNYVDMDEQIYAVKEGWLNPEDQRFVDFFQYLKQLSSYFNTKYNQVDLEYEQIFRSGKGAMIINGNWFLSDLERQTEQIPFDVARTPYLDKGVSAYGLDRQDYYFNGFGTPQLAISEQCRQDGKLELALDFLQFWCAPQGGAQVFYETGNFIPTIKGIALAEKQEKIQQLSGNAPKPVFQFSLHQINPKIEAEYSLLLRNYLEDKEMSVQQFIASFSSLIYRACNGQGT